jgi:hypothetical protein
MLRGGPTSNTTRTTQSTPAGSFGKSASVLLRNLDGRVVDIAASHSTRLIRISLATVFIWFGLLEIIGHSPVTEIVAQTMQWLPAPTGLLMLLLGVLEIALGLGLLFGRGAVLRVTLIVFLLHSLAIMAIVAICASWAMNMTSSIRQAIE